MKPWKCFQASCPHQRQQEQSVLPLAAGTSWHPSPHGDQLWWHRCAAFLMSSPLCLSRGNRGRRLLLCVCNWLPPWQRMRHGLISYLSEPRWVFSVVWSWTGKRLCTSVAQKSHSDGQAWGWESRHRCGPCQHGPLRGPGDEVCLTSGYWGWQRVGTPLLWSLALEELRAKDSSSPWLLPPALWEALEGPPGPPPSTKAMGQGWKTIFFLLQP